MLAKLLFLLLISIIILNYSSYINCKDVILYDPAKDDIELLDVSNFDKTLSNSDKVTLIEFFAHWCGTCQRFAPHWKELSKDTKPWHEKVVRIAALDCALSINDQICNRNHVEFYPTFKFFAPMSEEPASNMKEDENTSSEDFMSDIITFIESLSVKPAHFPILTSFQSERLDDLFEKNAKINYALLVFEPDNSFVGRKIILDFSLYIDKLIIRHVTPSSNKNLFNKMKIALDTKPVVFIIKNSKYSASYENLDTFLANQNQEELIEHNLVNFEDSHEVNGDEHPSDHKDDLRYIHAKQIRKFIKYNELLSDEQLDKLGDDIEAGQLRFFEPKKVVKQVLNYTNYRVHMIDLESNLNNMLRYEIPRQDIIKGEDLDVLKTWLNVLTKYYPGRKPVNNFLKLVSSRLNSVKESITESEWKKIVSFESPQVFLPDSNEFKHCKGSTEQYRGYPCSLWTMFHVLTVSHIEMEKQKDKPFEKFDSLEVISAIKGYITRFFGCKNCGENFAKETANLTDEVKKPYDEIKYLWLIHNRVNKRLHGDETEDPEYPKIQFPPKDKCPQCYKDSSKVNENDSPFEITETVKYLLTFYSIHGIDGEEELNKASDEYFEKKKLEKQNQIVKQIEPNVVDNNKKTNPYYNVNMVDIETSLNSMLKNELTRSDEISGENLQLLKNWLNVLAKYLPGKQSIHNYLVAISEKLNQYSDIIKVEEWEKLIDYNTPTAFLPKSTEWLHCKGSNEGFRGYPCSLWTMFHVLTVSHLEAGRKNSFVNFDPAEIITAVKGYITHFFGCRECGQNFAQETENFNSFLVKPNDEVLYLWRVHNRVNKRLSGDDTEDPEFKKVQFPTNENCPQCFKDASAESPYDEEETLKYLLKFYSVNSIEGAEKEELFNRDLLPPHNKKDDDNLHRMDIIKLETPAVVGGRDDLMGDSDKKIHVEDIVREQQEELPPHKDVLKHHDANRVDYEAFKESVIFDQNNKALDLVLSITVYTLVLLTFCCLYMYFKMLRKKTKFKKSENWLSFLNVRNNYHNN